MPMITTIANNCDHLTYLCGLPDKNNYLDQTEDRTISVIILPCSLNLQWVFDVDVLGSVEGQHAANYLFRGQVGLDYKEKSQAGL